MTGGPGSPRPVDPYAVKDSPHVTSTGRPDLRVSARNARFQQWQALLGNRNKRQRAGRFLVQGVRPITLAVEHGWGIDALLYADGGRPLSRWARELLDAAPHGAARVATAPELLAELGEKDDAAAAPELIAVAVLPDDDPARIPARPDLLAVAFDRPASPGNIGTMIRSADAFGAHGLIVAGHAADLYDPRTVRASTGSLFALPSVRLPSHRDVLAHVERVRAGGVPLRVVGTDETGPVEVAELDLTGPVLLVVGSEATGMSAAWRDACDDVARIPIGGAASSLNAAAAATVVLYEAARQRRAVTP